MKKRLSFALALVMALALLPAPAFAAGGFEEALEQVVVSAPKATKSSVWGYYTGSNGAVAKQAAGDYAGAITDYAAVIQYMRGNTDADSAINVINAYREIANCYGSLGQYGMASAAWRAAARRCAAYMIAFPNGEDKLQEQVSYERNADALDTKTELYLKTDDASLGSGKYFKAPGESVNGLVPGIYAEADPRLHDAYSSSKRYWNEFPAVVGVTAGVYLLYLDYGKPLSAYQSHVTAAKEKGFAIQLALQPRSGVGMVKEGDGYLRELAQAMESSGVQFYVRFAGEMNDASGGNSWFTENTQEYIKAFRTVADAVHTYAPSAAMVWAPNYYPSYNINDYYPGDAYVDFVGISLYMSYSPELDPLGQNEDNRRWIDEMDYLYSQYGDRKPIMITEGAVCLATVGGVDLTDFAVRQLKDLFLYLPIRYPNVKLMVWFGGHDEVGDNVYDYLTANQTVMNAYRDALTGSPSVLASVKAAAAPVYYGRLASGSAVPDGSVTLCGYVKGVKPIAAVRYAINGAKLGDVYAAPFQITADFSAYRGQTVEVTVTSFYAGGVTAGQETFSLRVAGAASAAPATPPAPAKGGTAYERSQTIELDGKSVTLPAYALKDGKGGETNYVKLRDLASLLNDTTARFNVGWDEAANAVTVTSKTAYAANGSEMTTPFSGDRSYQENTAAVLLDGAAAELAGIVLTDSKGGGYTYFKLRDVGKALGFNVGWSEARGIYLESDRPYAG
ncbi:MAG: hypothetical protein IJT71_01250 [Oscillospiraceae bacterium]|nr:hypothetical protein [Oscillospiraceae bacterium]